MRNLDRIGVVRDEGGRPQRVFVEDSEGVVMGLPTMKIEYEAGARDAGTVKLTFHGRHLSFLDEEPESYEAKALHTMSEQEFYEAVRQSEIEDDLAREDHIKGMVDHAVERWKVLLRGPVPFGSEIFTFATMGGGFRYDPDTVGTQTFSTIRVRLPNYLRDEAQARYFAEKQIREQYQ